MMGTSSASSHSLRDFYSDRDEARAKRTYLAVMRPGRDYVLPLRWVDVMPRVVARDLLAEVRAARANLARDMSGAAAAQTAAVSKWSLSPEKRARYNELKRARYAGSSEALKAENERRKAALRTPEQQKKHDDYIARKAKRSGS